MVKRLGSASGKRRFKIPLAPLLSTLRVKGTKRALQRAHARGANRWCTAAVSPDAALAEHMTRFLVLYVTFSSRGYSVMNGRCTSAASPDAAHGEHMAHFLVLYVAFSRRG